jgi:hypothetical protein
MGFNSVFKGLIYDTFIQIFLCFYHLRDWANKCTPTLILGVRMTGVTKQKFMSQNLSKKETSGLKH